MVSFHAAFSCLLVVLLAAGGNCGITVVNEVVPTEGQEYLFNCHGSGDLSYFMMHNEGELLVPAEYDRLEITVFQNATVFFQRISVEHEGTHLCIRNSGGKDQGYSTPLRVRPLPPDDLWENVYKPKFVTGFLAALVIAALFVLGCLVNKYRWRPTETDTSPIITNSAYVNPGMINEDAESGCSTKM